VRPGPVSENVDAVTVEACTGSLNRAVKAAFIETPVIPLAGVVLSTLGAGPISVVKLQE
jgi:hypothetical protein